MIVAHLDLDAFFAAVEELESPELRRAPLVVGGVAPVFDDARALAEAVQAVVLARTRLTCSLGVATSKVVAKVASDRRKPAGLTVVRPGREPEFLAPFPIRLLPGIGPRAEERLVAAGIETIGDLAALGDDQLRELVRGVVGRQLRDRARGVDPRRLEVSVERISISHEETFAQDIGDRERLHDELRRQATRLSEHLRNRSQVARTVTTKLRYPDFSIRTRSTSLPVGTDDGDRIGELACALLDRALRDRPGPLRLVGVGLSGLAQHVQLSLPSDVS